MLKKINQWFKKRNCTRKSNTLEEIYDPKNNSFAILNVIASLLIIFFHCYPLFYGITSNKIDIFSKWLAPENLGSVFVAMFFVISGFMISTSIKRSKSIWQYLKKRIIRIFPSLLFCLIICAMIIAPVLSDISKWEFLKNTNLYKSYIIDNILFYKNTVYSIADIFVNNPYPNAINGSIWTIKHTFFMYLLMIPLFYIFLRKDNRKKYFKYYYTVILALTMVSFTGYYDNFFNMIATKFNNIGVLVEGKHLLRLICYFSSGVAINLYKDKIIYNKEYIILSLILGLITRKTVIFSIICLLIIPYLTIYLGSLKSKLKVLDISYQIYIWAFPVQQLLMYYGNHKINFVLYVILSLIISIMIGLITYFICDYIPKWISKRIKKSGKIENAKITKNYKFNYFNRKKNA